MDSRSAPILLMLCLLFCAGTCGCLTYSFGDAVYDGENLKIQIFNSGEPKEVVVQATIFHIVDFQQTEIYRRAEYMYLESGENEYIIPIDLQPGQYKLYLYVMTDDSGRTTEIRDIVV